MKRIGVLGGISAQATMDFEARVHRVSQRLIPQHWNQGYPPMVVWYHRRPPIRVRDDGRPYEPREIDPELVEAARWLGKAVDFIVIPCNAAHVGAAAIRDAAGCPVLSMIDLALDDIARRGWHRVGVTGFASAPAVYLDPLRRRGIPCAEIDMEAQARLDAAIVAVAEGRDGPEHAQAASAAVATLRAQAVDGVVLGCTEIPLLLPDDDGSQRDLINPVALLAAAAVASAIEGVR
jgi:aspartate racemase